MNLIFAATDPALIDAQVTACIDLKAPAVDLFWGLEAKLVERLRSAAIVVVYQAAPLKRLRSVNGVVEPRS